MKRILGFTLTVYLFLFLWGTAQAQSKTYEIAMFVPHSKGDSFWTPLENFMRAAGNDLGMTLRVYFAEGSRVKMREQIKEATEGPNKVDAVVFQNFKQGGPSFLKIAEAAQVPAFLFNAGVDHTKAGKPREKYKHWLGEMLPDDERAGFDLTNILLDTALERDIPLGPYGKLEMIAITGVVSDGAAIEREKGLQRAVSSRSDVELRQVVPANWKQSEAKQRFTKITKRYKHITVAWAANDPMALGVLDGAKEINMPIITGGVDWTNEALQAVQSGKLVATIGGHFMEGGWVMVLLHDYFQGKDFAAESVSIKSKMGVLTQKNVKAYFEQFGDGNWEAIDFKQFSKVHNPELAEYDFSLYSVLNQFTASAVGN